jgi:hypothetical protein
MALRLKRNLAELRDGDVRFISLVDRAATRMPFRVVKRQGDEEMIDLSAIGKGKIVKGEQVQEPEKPSIAAVVVFERKGDSANAKIAEAIKAAGLSIEHAVKNEDKTITYMQAAEMPKDVKLVRLSDQVLVAVKGFQPGGEGKESDFASSANSSGFYQGVDSALDVLFSKICAVLQDATAPKDAASSIDQLVEGFGEYVNELVTKLPAEAFKADISVRSTIAKGLAWLDATKKFEAAKTAKKMGGMSVDGQTDKDADDPDGVNLLSLTVTVPEGFTGNPDDWSGMEDGQEETSTWVADSTNNRGHQDPSQAKKGDIMNLQDLFKQLQTKPEGFTDTDGDWAAMSTGDKMSWLDASYNKANAQGAQADKKDVVEAARKLELVQKDWSEWNANRASKAGASAEEAHTSSGHEKAAAFHAAAANYHEAQANATTDPDTKQAHLDAAELHNDAYDAHSRQADEDHSAPGGGKGSQDAQDASVDANEASRNLKAYKREGTRVKTAKKDCAKCHKSPCECPAAKTGDAVNDDTKDEHDDKAADSKKLDAVLAGLATLTNQVTESTKKMAALESKVDTAVQKSDNVEKKLGTTVLAMPNNEDFPTNGVKVVKKDSDPRTGNFDTAMLSRRQKREQLASK